MMKPLGPFAVLSLLVVCSSALWAQAAPPLFSWEEGTEGWQVNEDNGQKLAKGAKAADTGVTAGKKSLAIDMIAGYKPAVRRDDPELAAKLKGKKIAIDATAPEGTADMYVQVTLASVADGMEWKAADPQEVPQDGKPHTLTFDLSEWPLPATPGWCCFFIITNTPEGGEPKTVYVDNLRVVDAPAAATAPSPADVLSSWEDGMDGWAVNVDNEKKMARDAVVSETNATAGKKSLSIAMIDGYHATIRCDDASLAKRVKGKKIAIDVTAPEGTAKEFLQVSLAVVADGMEWKAAEVQDVPQDGKPHTLKFDLSGWPIPSDPQWFNLFIVTNTAEKSQPGTVYVDNLRTAE